MRSRWRAWALAGPLAIVGILEFGAARAQAQFPIFFGGEVLQPNGRKLGIPPSAPIRQSDYPQGTLGYAPWPPGNYPGGSYYNRRHPQTNYAAPQPRYYYPPRATTYAAAPGSYYYAPVAPGR